MKQHCQAFTFPWENGRFDYADRWDYREEKVNLGKKALVAMCADNGVVEEGVTQTGQEVTAIVADNFVKENHYRMCNVPPVWSGCKASRCGNGKRHYSTYRSESYVWNPQYDERSGYDKRRSHKGN